MIFTRSKKSDLILAQQFLMVCTFQAEKFRADGTVTYKGPVFRNTILDSGLDLLATHHLGFSGGSAMFRNLNVGEGSTTPSQSQTGLASYLASTNDGYGDLAFGYDTADPIHKWERKVYQFDIGECTGNLTEVGLSNEVNDEYFNRQLFRDASDNPITITVLADEGLRVTATLYLYGDLQLGNTENGSFLLDGSTNIDYTRELTSDTTWYTYDDTATSLGYLGAPATDDDDDQAFAEITDSDVDFTGTEHTGKSIASYVSGNYYRDVTYIWDAASYSGNINSILFHFAHPPPFGGVGIRTSAYSAFRLASAINKTDVEEFRVTLRRAWGRY